MSAIIPPSPRSSPREDVTSHLQGNEFLHNSREILNQIFKSRIGHNYISPDETISPRDVKKSKALLTSFFGAKLLPKPIAADDSEGIFDSPRLESDGSYDSEGENIWSKLRDCAMGEAVLSPDDATEILLLLESLINTDMHKSHEEVVESIFQRIDPEDLKTIDEDFLHYLTSHYAKLQSHESNATDFESTEAEKQDSPANSGAEDMAMSEKLRFGPEVQSMLVKLYDWDFNVFDLERLVPYPLVIVTESILCDLNLTWKLELNITRLRRFLIDIQESYQAKPYHNFVHATDCTQTMFHFLTQCHMMTAIGIHELPTLALILGAAIHDVGHPGVTGRYLISISDPLAIQYNDSSPLENMHLATAFNIWMKAGNNFTERLPKVQFRELRRMIIETVLFTDNDKHFVLMEKLESLFSSGDINHLQPANNSSSSGPNGSSSTNNNANNLQKAKSGLPSDDVKVMRRAASDLLVRNVSQGSATGDVSDNSLTNSPLTLKAIDETRGSPSSLLLELPSPVPRGPGNLRRSISTRSRPVSMGVFSRPPLDSPMKSGTAPSPATTLTAFAPEPRQLLLMQVALHAADVSNPVKPWPLHMRWYPRLMEEFYYQGDLEREQGMPITFAFDRHNPVPLPKFQLGFLKAIVSPMYKLLSKIPGISISHCLGSLENNVKNWEILLASDETGERIRTAADVAAATATWSTQTFSASSLSLSSLKGVPKSVEFAATTTTTTDTNINA